MKNYTVLLAIIRLAGYTVIDLNQIIIQSAYVKMNIFSVNNKDIENFPMRKIKVFKYI